MSPGIFLGAFTAIFVGVLLLSKYQEVEGEPRAIDSLGDWFVTLTSSEESRLAQLQPEVQDRVRELLSRCRELGVIVYVGQTLRTSAQEAANIAAGKTSANLVYSWHELGRAVDLYPTVGGAPDYDAVNLEQFRVLHGEAVMMGFRSLAFNPDGSKHLLTNSKGRKIWDGGHVEWREPYATIAEAVSAEGKDYGIA